MLALVRNSVRWHRLERISDRLSRAGQYSVSRKEERGQVHMLVVGPRLYLCPDFRIVFAAKLDATARLANLTPFDSSGIPHHSLSR